MFDSNDDYDFAPSSRLASLFDNPPGFGGGSSSSNLIYTAPKQPKVKKEVDVEEPAKNTPQNVSSVIIAKAITLWKVQEGNQKVPLGRHGLAIVGYTSQNLYELIFYKEKNNILLRLKLNDCFTWHVYPDNFGVFYDGNQCFMVKFDSRNDENSCVEILIKHCKVDSSELLKKQNKEEPENSDTSESVRADILQRIKNMGQQILPRDVKNTSTDLSDSELDDSQNKKNPPRKIKRNVQKTLEKVSSSTENQLVVSPVCSVPNIVPNLINNPVIYQTQPQYDVTNFLMMQNAELKANLMSINNKLDNINIGTCSGVDDKKLQSKLKGVELKLENVSLELEKYQKDYADLQKDYENLKSKGGIEESLLKEKDSVIFEQKNEILSLQKRLEDSAKNVAKIESLEEEIQGLKNDLEQKEVELNKFEHFPEKIEELNKLISDLNLQINDYELQLNNLQSEKSEINNKHQENLQIFSDLIKNNMNEMYQNFMSEFMEKSSYSVAEIQANIARNLKSTTYKIIENSRDIFK